MAGLVLDHPFGTALDLGVGIDQHLRDLACDRRTVGQLPSRGDVQLNPATPAHAVPNAASSTVSTRRTISRDVLGRLGGVPAR
jgi:hypothetical protein